MAEPVPRASRTRPPAESPSCRTRPVAARELADELRSRSAPRSAASVFASALASPKLSVKSRSLTETSMPAPVTPFCIAFHSSSVKSAFVAMEASFSRVRRLGRGPPVGIGGPSGDIGLILRAGAVRPVRVDLTVVASESADDLTSLSASVTDASSGTSSTADLKLSHALSSVLSSIDARSLAVGLDVVPVAVDLRHGRLVVVLRRGSSGRGR